MRHTTQVSRGAEAMSRTLRWRLVLVVHGFDEAQASQIAFLRWMYERGEVGGAQDGAEVSAPASTAA